MWSLKNGQGFDSALFPPSNMKKFVVAVHSSFTSEIEMYFATAEDMVEAALNVLKALGFEPPPMQIMEEVKQFAFDCDHAINAAEIDKSNWRNYTTIREPDVEASICKIE